MAANWSAGRAAKFENVGRNEVVASKSGPVETGPTVLVATALLKRTYTCISWKTVIVCMENHKERTEGRICS